MERRGLGKDGREISVVGFGAWEAAIVLGAGVIVDYVTASRWPRPRA